ncbi:uncharacterized protein PHALS_00426 [Plasmopara halstedii]|uniref:RxLR-like protein n=1 Tax=Plasmopara halstedii TaxID=4781 RepID=A0A0N7L3K2_PLAHL|nr:uncharacterized protein PHALS_00426 [Plasmopara halstedii]CEG36107.1 hypothetical protein PHALS_00426 [Plasmopara halstedii]|eukprot:XP_024572476.1 hypothetical protein PHALS_00426 [Plasmopara halstedii]
MVPVIILAAIGTLVSLCGSIAASKDSCVQIDFTTQEEEFADFNTMIRSPKTKKFLTSVVGSYDPLVRENVVMDNISYDFMAQSLTLWPVIDSMRVTGLSSILPHFINVNTSNSVTMGLASSSQVTVDATVNVQVEPMGMSLTVHLQCDLDRPKMILGAEVNMLACATGVPVSQCSNVTVSNLQSQFAKATTKKQYVSLMKEVLMKFESASVTAFLLDFRSISGLTVEYSSPDIMTKSLLHFLPSFTDAVIDKKSDMYRTWMSKLSASAPAVLNAMIIKSLAPLFGGTCLSDD